MRVVLFNLTPYRKVIEQKRQRKFWMLSVLVLSLGALFCYQVTSELNDRLAAKQKFIEDIEEVTLQVADRARQAEALRKEREILQSRVRLLEAVDKRSMAQCKVFERLDGSRPERSRISSLNLKSGLLAVSGETADVPVLSSWVEQLDEDKDLFDQTDIVEVEKWVPPGSNGTVLKEVTWGGQRLDFHEFTLQAKLNPDLRPTLPVEGGEDAGY